MKQKIAFRGLSVEDNRWVYGYYEKIPVGIGVPVEIIHRFSDWNLSFPVKIREGTAGQLTGMKDKNGVPIYQEDICKAYNGKIGVVQFCVQHGFSGFFLVDHVSGLSIDGTGGWVVLGNIHENIELVEQV